ncbi:MAG TPA: tRNA (adenosine(37)-N6)-dimethylallyltransferase MiaA [Candidatus Bathyarchaeia archaeon]|nr:tRNA (adenosine(37)-N6)-dimethylallyltransferase MiaA [Candidatus Bathyarchaeia archaeon]
MITAIAILGPTGSGKSRLGMALAQRAGGEILSIDSRQAYRGLDIGTAKPTPDERRTVPHHLIDILDLDEKSNAESFARLAHAAIRAVASRGRTPLLVGGSGFYFRAIEEGLFTIELDPAQRISLAESLRGVPTEILHARLADADVESALRIHRNDRYRIVRALEVVTLTGKSLSAHLREQGADRRRHDIRFIKLGLRLQRSSLHDRIGRRTRGMFERGWTREVQNLLAGGATPNQPGMRTLGYPQIVAHVRGEITFDETVRRVLELTRQYAKRQVTWFKKERQMHWLEADSPALLDSADELLSSLGSG